jgi:hypothetical protein
MTTYREAVAIKARSVREFIRNHPACRHEDIVAAIGFEKVTDCLDMLPKHKLIHKKQPMQEDGKRPCIWYPSEPIE